MQFVDTRVKRRRIRIEHVDWFLGQYVRPAILVLSQLAFLALYAAPGDQHPRSSPG